MFTRVVPSFHRWTSVAEFPKRKTAVLPSEDWGATHGSGLWVVGRISLNLWRIMRSEV